MNSRVALITFLDNGGPGISNELPGAPTYPGHGLPSGGWGPTDPGYGRPIYGGGYPSTGFPPVYPGNALPGIPPGSTLPVYPFDPTKPMLPDKPEDPESPSNKPIQPGDSFKLKCTVFGLILVRTSTAPEIDPQS